MNKNEKIAFIEKYIRSYNAFDVDTLLLLIHPEIDFKNISGGEVNATAFGMDEFRCLVEQSKELFSNRKQTITEFKIQKGQVFIEVDYEAVLVADLPNGMKAGEILRLKGRSEFTFRDGKIYKLTDIS